MVLVMTSLIPQSNQRHVCRVCDKTFRASSLLDIHMRVHVGAKPYVCPTCGHRATQKGNLKLHMKKHHGMDLPPHIDMVPDSGIWRDNEEFAITEASSPLSETDPDDPKRKKVITQAMSSLLDPSVVDLIKKCQNSVGQGMTGRITESLKDFIKVAQDSNIVKHSEGNLMYTNKSEPVNSVSVIMSSRRQSHHQNGGKQQINTPEIDKETAENLYSSWNIPETELELVKFYNERLRNLAFRVDISDKDKYMAYFKLYRYNAMLEQKMKHKSLRQVNSNEEDKDLLNAHRNEKSKSDTKLDSISRVSPGVLSMLRKTVLNSVEQKVAKSKTPELAEQINCDDAEISYPQKPKVCRISSPNFSSTAMKSLAAIGKTYQPTVDDVRLASSPTDIYNGSPSLFKCQFCQKEYKYKSVLEIHMRSHTGERPYKCSYCEYAGTQHNCLKLHIQRHHPTEYFTYHADLLGKGPGLSVDQSSSLSPTNGEQHCRVACLSPVNCPVCGRVSPSPGYLKIHMRSHKKSLDHVCHICGRGFKEYWYLSTHLKTHEREMSSIKLNSQTAVAQFQQILRASQLDQNSNFNSNFAQTNFLLENRELLSRKMSNASQIETSFQPFVPAYIIRQSSPTSPTNNPTYLSGIARAEPTRCNKRKSSNPIKILPQHDQEEPEIKRTKSNKNYMSPPLNKLPLDKECEDQPLDLSIRKQVFKSIDEPIDNFKLPRSAAADFQPLNLCTNVH